MDDILQSPFFKILLGVISFLITLILSIGGSYIVFIIKKIADDIKQLKDFFVVQISDVKEDVTQNRKDIQHLYNLFRSTDQKTIENTSRLEALKEDHDRRHKGK